LNDVFANKINTKESTTELIWAALTFSRPFRDWYRRILRAGLFSSNICGIR